MHAVRHWYRLLGAVPAHVRPRQTPRRDVRFRRTSPSLLIAAGQAPVDSNEKRG